MMTRLGNAIMAIVTGLPTNFCACGFSSRCGYQFTRHACEPNGEVR